MAKKKGNDPNYFDPIVINGCLIEPNTVYEIVAREPYSWSPAEYVEMGSCKERHPDVGNSVTLSQQDSGFYDMSPIFNTDSEIKNDWTERKKRADLYYDIFAAPMGMYIPEIERIRIPSDNEFFDNLYNTVDPQTNRSILTVSIGEGRQFNTANPVDRFHLYIAIIDRQLIMKGKRDEDERAVGLRSEDDYGYNSDAQYAYISVTSRKNKAEQKAEFVFNLTNRFGELLRSDKPLLLGLLRAINFNLRATIDDAALITLFQNKIVSNPNILREFSKVLEQYDANPKGYGEELKILELLESEGGRKIINVRGTTFYLGEHSLGANLKGAAHILRNDPELYKTFMTQLEKEF